MRYSSNDNSNYNNDDNNTNNNNKSTRRVELALVARLSAKNISQFEELSFYEGRVS